jgi:hypothetical protein
MDGTVVDHSKYVKNSIKRRIQFKLSKEQKIKSLIVLLEELGISFTFGPATMSEHNVLQPYYIRIYGDDARRLFDVVGQNKQMPEAWKDLEKTDFIDVLETIKETDGYTPHRKTYWATTNKEYYDLILFLLKKHNIYFKEHNPNSRKSGFTEGKKQYYLSFDITIFSGGEK